MDGTTNIILQRPPKPWEIIDRGRGLRIGGRTCRLDDVADFSVRLVVEPNILGHIVAFGFFSLAGIAFIVPVAASLARPKFLIGGALFVAIGLTALLEIRRARDIRLYAVDLALRNGETLTFTTTEAAQMQALAAVLGTRRA